MYDVPGAFKTPPPRLRSNAANADETQHTVLRKDVNLMADWTRSRAEVVVVFDCRFKNKKSPLFN